MIPLKIQPQPDDTTCGPTCLQAVYDYYKDPISLSQVISESATLDEGGTLAVMLANHALRRGYWANIYTYNLTLFDPSWNFSDPLYLIDKLEKQKKTKRSKKLHKASEAYIQFLQLGGKIHFEDLSPNLLKRHLDKRTPILTGLSATYLYNCSREYTDENERSVYDDVMGTPMGHFVVLCGMNKMKQVIVADPFKENPVSPDHFYPVKMRRLLHSILLGIVTYDANLLYLQPR